MANYAIKYDRNMCIGAATCVAVCPENYSLDSDNKAVIKKMSISDKELKSNIAAIKSCPNRAIEIYDANGKKLAP